MITRSRFLLASIAVVYCSVVVSSAAEEQLSVKPRVSAATATKPHQIPKDTANLTETTPEDEGVDRPGLVTVKRGQTIQEVIDALPDDETAQTIQIPGGVYREQINITRIGPTYLTASLQFSPGFGKCISLIRNLRSQAQEHVAIEFDSSHAKGKPGSNPSSATIHVSNCGDFKMTGIHVINNGGRGPRAPALAFSVGRGATVRVYKSNIEGFQDTLHVNDGSRGYFEDCVISGSVDFVYGSGLAWLERCKLISRQTGGAISAMRGRAGKRNGAYFSNCTFQGESEAITHVAIGQPWDHMARVVCLNTEMDRLIEPNGFRGWQPDAPALDNVFFAEYNSKGPGSRGRNATFPPGTPLTTPTNETTFVFQLSATEARAFTVERVFDSYFKNE